MNRFPLCFVLLFSISVSAAVNYEANWQSLDSRPLPTWYDESKFGIMICIGLYSVPSFENEWFWQKWASGDASYVDYMKRNYPPGFKYQDFAPMFKAELFDADEWTDLFSASGAKYIVFTSKHCEGYCNWQSNASWNWNTKDVGPHRDLVGELASSIRTRSDIHFGLYHSLYEWFNPMYLADKASGFVTQHFVKEKTMPELYELVNSYQPDVIWSDGDGEAPDSYWNSTDFLAWLYNESPVKDTVVTNDRWGRGTACRHGGFFNCRDRYFPGKLQPHKWENAMTIDSGTWGYSRVSTLSDYHPIEYLVGMLVKTVSCGGNLLMNVGPSGDGRILPIFEERLRQMGAWLKVNGEAIYGTKPWIQQNDNATLDIWYTSKKTDSGTSVYAVLLSWPKGSSLTLGAATPTDQTTVSLLGYVGKFSWMKAPTGGITIKLPVITFTEMPCEWAWTFKLDNLA